MGARNLFVGSLTLLFGFGFLHSEISQKEHNKKEHNKDVFNQEDLKLLQHGLPAGVEEGCLGSARFAPVRYEPPADGTCLSVLVGVREDEADPFGRREVVTRKQRAEVNLEVLLERFRLKRRQPACCLNASESFSRGKGLSGTGTLRAMTASCHGAVRTTQNSVIRTVCGCITFKWPPQPG